MLNICFTVGGLLHVHEKVNNFKFNIFINFSGAQYDTNAVDRTLCGENEGVQISCAVTRAADQGLCFHICKKHVFVIKQLILCSDGNRLDFHNRSSV